MLESIDAETASMRSPWLVAVAAALAGGAVGGALVAWRLPPSDREGGTVCAPNGAADASVLQRLDRLEREPARAVPPATTLRGAPSPRDVAPAAMEPESPQAADLASQVEALKAQVAVLAATQERLAEKVGLPPPWPTDPAEVERIRERWRSKLQSTDQALREMYPNGPDPREDPVGWSRLDDHRRARALFEAATDAAALRALSEGEFRSYFTLRR